jgi:hypothetical protein
MHPNFDNACQNVVNHVANVNHAFVGHSVVCVDATAKRLLSRKRLTTQPECSTGDTTSPSYQPGDSQSGYRPDMSSPRDAMSRGGRLALQTRSLGAPMWAAEDAPAAIWAALVIARALAS